MDPVSSTTSSPSNSNPSVTSMFKKSVNWVVGVVVLAIFWQWINSPMIVTVTGVGEVSAPATSAVVSFSITSTDGSIQNAISNVNAKALAITELLKSNGVVESDIAQGQVTTIPGNLISEGAGGYQAVIEMAAKTTDISGVSTLISELYNNGVLVVSQPILSVDNPDDLENEAFSLALKDAKKDASNVGWKNLKFIRKVTGINQVSSGNTATATTKADVLSTDSVAIQNGVFKITKAVSVSYKMW